MKKGNVTHHADNKYYYIYMRSKLLNNSYFLINYLNKTKETSVAKKVILDSLYNKREARILNATNFIYNEIPIRFSKRIKELENLPFKSLNYRDELFTLRDWYLNSLNDISNLKEPSNLSDCDEFRDTVRNILNRHQTTLITISKGISKLNKDENYSNMIKYNKFLTNFCINRTKTRFLLDNYYLLFNENTNYIGNINLHCNLKNIIDNTMYDVESITEINRMELPTFDINVLDTNFIFNDNFLIYPILEILKNSVVACQNVDNPKINIELTGDENLKVLKISDNGYGIKYEDMNKIWDFSYTTAQVTFEDNFDNDFENSNPICGFGYGLPISKILLNTLGCDIKIFSKYGKGTDTYIIIDQNYDWTI